MSDKVKAVLAGAAMVGAGLPEVKSRVRETAEQMLARATKGLTNNSTVTLISSEKRKKKEPSKWRKNKARRGF